MQFSTKPKMIKQNLLLLMLCLLGIIFQTDKASALIDLRAGYTVLNATPSAVNTAIGTLPGITKMQGLNADVIVSLPLMPVGLGLRGEFLANKQSNSTGDITATLSRVSLLINSRFIDTLAFFGPIASVGLTNEFKLDTVAGATTNSYKASGGMSASVGVEGGAKLLGLLVGGELGYLYSPIKDLKTSTGTAVTNAGAAVDVNMSGVYFRAMIGFGF